MYSSAIIVAAGKGKRMKHDKSKLFIELDGVSVLERTLNVFLGIDEISEIILVLNKKHKDYLNYKDYIKKGYFDKESGNRVEIKIVYGGEQRQNSVLNGLVATNPKCEVVIIHDGARPFVTPKIVKETIEAAMKYGASSVGVLVKDTIKIISEDGFIEKTLDRGKIFSIQTPQTFKYELILKAHQIARKDGFIGTDDNILIERMGEKVKIVNGDYNNIKITTKDDLLLANMIISNESK